MAENKLNQQEEELDDLNLFDEDEIEVEEDDDERPELSDEEKERIALEVHNRKTGKSYKSWDDVAKSEKERDRMFAQNPQNKKPENTPTPQAQPVEKLEIKSQTLDADVVEEVMLIRFPELESAPETRKELKELAGLKGVSELSLYKQSTYFKNRAKSESESKKETEQNLERITPPSPGDPGTKKIKATTEDVRIANQFYGGDVAKYLKYKNK